MIRISIIGLALFICSCSSAPKTSETIKEFVSTTKGYSKANTTAKLSKLCEQGTEFSCRYVKGVRAGKSQLSIMQGPTDSNSIRLNILQKKKSDISYILFDAKGFKFKNPISIKTSSRRASSWVIKDIYFTDLEAGKAYQLDVFSNEGVLIDSRKVSTWAPRVDHLKFALTSCAADGFSEHQKEMWSSMFAKSPEAVFLIGDNFYIDYKDQKKVSKDKINPDWIWSRFVDGRNSMQIYFEKQLIPVYAMWDDHDYGANNGGKNFSHKKESAEIFKSFFSIYPNNYLKLSNYGISYSLRLGGQDFYFLDDRYYRTPKADAGKKEAHFGREQELWLFSSMKNSVRPTWLISGDQFFGDYHKYESYSGNHPFAFKRFIKQLKKQKQHALFLSGDRHLVELQKIPTSYLGYNSYEITSSGIHTKVFPGSLKNHPNKLRIGGVDGKLNYMILKSKTNKLGLKIEATSYGLENKVLLREKLSL